MKSNKGITLVALVITIIVLLILAGVSISLVVGDNGVLTQSKNSSDSTKIGQMQEALQIAISDVQTAYFGNYALNASVAFDDEVTFGAVGTALKNQGYTLVTVKSKKDATSTDGDLNLSNFPDTMPTTSTTAADDNGKFYISDGTNGIEVWIAKTSGGTALKVEYVKNDSGKIEFKSMK